MINLEHLTYSYRKGPNAVNDATGRVTPGIWLLLGENGAGKTTLLKLMAGLLRPQTGVCRLDGEETALHAPSVMRRLFFLPDELEVPAKTVAALAATDGIFYPNFNKETLERNLVAFGLTGHEEITDTSLGTRRKLLAAYALALGVDMLLLDEPAHGLDIDSKKTLRRLMAGCIESEQTVIVSTHNISDLRELYDGLMLMHKGHLAVCLTADDISSRLSCVRSATTVPDALYSERSAGVVSSIVRAEGDETGDIDYALLYSAVMSGNTEIIKILSDNG